MPSVTESDSSGGEEEVVEVVRQAKWTTHGAEYRKGSVVRDLTKEFSGKVERTLESHNQLPQNGANPPPMEHQPSAQSHTHSDHHSTVHSHKPGNKAPSPADSSPIPPPVSSPAMSPDPSPSPPPARPPVSLPALSPHPSPALPPVSSSALPPVLSPTLSPHPSPALPPISSSALPPLSSPTPPPVSSPTLSPQPSPADSKSPASISEHLSQQSPDTASEQSDHHTTPRDHSGLPHDHSHSPPCDPSHSPPHNVLSQDPSLARDAVSAYDDRHPPTTSSPNQDKVQIASHEFTRVETSRASAMEVEGFRSHDHSSPLPPSPRSRPEAKPPTPSLLSPNKTSLQHGAKSEVKSTEVKGDKTHSRRSLGRVLPVTGGWGKEEENSLARTPSSRTSTSTTLSYVPTATSTLQPRPQTHPQAGETMPADTDTEATSQISLTSHLSESSK